jgi:acyl-CoA thioesterase I
MQRSIALFLCAFVAGCGLDDGGATAGRDTASLAAAEARAGGEAGGPATARDERGTVLFVGTSLTAGYGLGESFAYPARLQERIDAAALPFRVVNAGISGETSAGGLSRIDWMLQRPVDVLVLELGANDGLRGLDVAAMRSNIDAIIRRTREAHPEADIVILGMEAPPNLGARYTARFRQTFGELAREHGAAYVPFLLEGVAGEPALNLDDGIHPNRQGHRLMAETVWAVLAGVLERRARHGGGNGTQAGGRP